MSTQLFPMPEPKAPLEGRSVKFVVYCRPQPQGSTRAFFIKKLGRAVITTDNKKLKPYRQQVSETAFALEGARKFEKHVPVRAEFAFYLEKPNSVPKRRQHPVVKPDVDKLARSTTDSLTGILIDDDAQIVQLVARKFYGTPERVEIRLTEVL